MPDPSKHVAAEVRYEVRIAYGPTKFSINNVEFKLEQGRDIPVIYRMVILNGTILDQKIVAVIGNSDSGSGEFINLINFLNDGGVIGLHYELARS